MSTYIRRHVGQLVVAGFDGPTIPDDLRRVARDFDLGGVILFARNVEEPVQVAELSHDAQGLASELPLWVSIDQEGGACRPATPGIYRVAADARAR
jgi:beta-N-acetylhexosaminidase